MTKAERVERAKEKLAYKAEKARKESDVAYEKSRQLSEHFYMGQPILIGHHSEKKARSVQKKMHNYMEKSIEADKQLKGIEYKMGGVGTAILSRDDDAIELLDKKIADLKAKQEFYKEVNKYTRKKDKEGLIKKYGEKTAEECFKPDYSGRIGIPSFTLTNNNANIRRLEKRRAELATVKQTETKEETINGIRVVENTEIMRIQLFFDGKPDEETISKLKRSGFRWAPSEGAWQRQLNANSKYAAREFLRGAK